MSAVEELEEGEITDSDSMGEEQKLPKTERPPVQHYSIFDNQPMTTSRPNNIPRPPENESDNSDHDGDYSEDDIIKKKKLHGSKTDSKHSTFINPNFVNNAGRMPPVPRPSNKSIWGSVLQEQILSAEVGNFSMERKLHCDRDVESYDYTRAKQDNRPHPVEDEIKPVEEDLFGEVIDLEKVASKQRKTLKRKHVAQRLGKRQSVRERADLPGVSESSSVEEVTYFISDKLEETKVHLIRRVVQGVGRAKALDLLKETEKVEASGGMMIMNGSRRRTPGGVYLMLLKKDKEVSQSQLDEIFEEENRWTLELRKRKRKKARSRRRRTDHDQQQNPSTATTEAGDTGNKTSSMEVVEDNNSRSSVEGQTGSPKNHADHLSDAQESLGTKDQEDSTQSDSEEENSDIKEDFDTQLAQMLKAQAAAKGAKEATADYDADAITLDDVLDIGVDDDYID